ncbi:helix-turn-helix domain-containing protein [Pediococcus pentosaceus]|uniref:helix-turn-helix domain-containing protein n=1 Tax=Pediococcus pentosaceus TaxID=1255 RepID=UPI001E65C953|nr:helix-turn-helix domain-containing protein [Pediococcus pentosaceus]MCG7196543.1 helix-turn-helix domain-containing protein [Pediococcus pentosaceus]MCI2396215.1 helix-turn-helix domain-containing protein [Pediococcus pentosaceus]
MNEDKPNYYSITPANVRYDKSLPMGARFMYGEITALTKKDGYCWAGDSYFAELYEVTNTTIQNWLRALERKGYISRKRIYKEGTKQIKNRYIRLFDTPTQNNLGTYVKNINDPTQNNLDTYPKNIKNPTQNNLRDSITSTITFTTTNNNKPSKPPKPVADRDHFESLWKLYPNKKGKESAWNSYKQSIKAGATDDEIKQGINNYLAEIKAKQTPKRYIKHGQTWFKQKGWQDEYDTTPEVQNAGRKTVQRETLPEWAQDNSINHPAKTSKTTASPEEIQRQLAKLKARKEG